MPKWKISLILGQTVLSDRQKLMENTMLQNWDILSNFQTLCVKLKSWKNRPEKISAKKGKGSGFMDDWTILKKRAEQESFHSEAINQNDELAPGLRGWARPST